MAITPEQAIDQVNDVFGKHKGFRALHAKGTLWKGTFTATPQAAELTRAAHMQGGEIPVTVRVSNGSGNPHHPDYAPDARGLATKFYLPDGSRTDIVAVSSPRFPNRTPDGFIELVKAQGAGPAAAFKLPAFFARHPEALKGLPANVPTLRPPSSYAVIPYYGIHSFKWINQAGEERFVRYKWLPQASGPGISPWAARRKGSNYLQDELNDRVQQGPIRFTLELQLAEPGDPVDDPSAPWPKTRPRVAAGTLEITAPETGREKDGDVLVFDPTRVTDGIELSGDPVLHFRARAYSASVERRI
jgi:catalase